jgi:hypothetical protein
MVAYWFVRIRGAEYLVCYTKHTNLNEGPPYGGEGSRKRLAKGLGIPALWCRFLYAVIDIHIQSAILMQELAIITFEVPGRTLRRCRGLNTRG